MATNAELESRVKSLEKALDEATGAISRLAKEVNSNASGLGGLMQKFHEIKGEVFQVKQENKMLAERTRSSVGSYE